MITYGHVSLMTSMTLPFLFAVLSVLLSQTSFSHISINSLSILMVSMAMESPQKNLLIDVSHILRNQYWLRY